MTHESLRKRALKWLTLTNHCGAVLSEIVAACGEIPDAIGWQAHRSVAVECKVSRADFLANQSKPHSWNGMGVGQLRFYLCPPDLLTEKDVRGTDWGLLYANEKHVAVVVQGTMREQYDLLSERTMLVSALRRVRTREFLTIVREGEDAA